MGYTRYARVSHSRQWCYYNVVRDSVVVVGTTVFVVVSSSDKYIIDRPMHNTFTITSVLTRSFAIAEGPRDDHVSQNLLHKYMARLM